MSVKTILCCSKRPWISGMMPTSSSVRLFVCFSCLHRLPVCRPRRNKVICPISVRPFHLCQSHHQQKRFISTRSLTLLKNGSAPTSKPKGAVPRPSHLNVFDRHAKLIQKYRASFLPESHVYDYVKDEAGFVLADRVIDIKRDLDLVLDLGCGKGHVLKYLNSSNVGSVVATDRCLQWLIETEAPEDIPCEKILMDEENIIFPDNKFNMVVSCLNLHWVNNLPKTFRRINQILKPDGVFLAAVFAGQTLYELRCSLQLTELEREGGIGTHVSPFANVQDIGGLLSINGFTMLTIDTQEIKINYPSMFELMEDLKGMGENNASWNRKTHIGRDTLLAAAAVYKELYGNEDGSVPATFQIIYLIAWKPDPSQPKPLPQQTPDVSFKDLGNMK